jgi:hypothetical protein
MRGGNDADASDGWAPILTPDRRVRVFRATGRIGVRNGRRHDRQRPAVTAAAPTARVRA